MAKSYNPEAVEKELDKLTLDEVIVEYNRLGTVIHEKLIAHDAELDAQRKHSQELKMKLTNKESK